MVERLFVEGLFTDEQYVEVKSFTKFYLKWRNITFLSTNFMRTKLCHLLNSINCLNFESI